jgi:hypothetical protein
MNIKEPKRRAVRPKSLQKLIKDPGWVQNEDLTAKFRSLSKSLSFHTIYMHLDGRVIDVASGYGILYETR